MREVLGQRERGRWWVVVWRKKRQKSRARIPCAAAIPPQIDRTSIFCWDHHTPLSGTCTTSLPPTSHVKVCCPHCQVGTVWLVPGARLPTRPSWLPCRTTPSQGCMCCVFNSTSPQPPSRPSSFHSSHPSFAPFHHVASHSCRHRQWHWVRVSSCSSPLSLSTCTRTTLTACGFHHAFYPHANILLPTPTSTRTSPVSTV